MHDIELGVLPYAQSPSLFQLPMVGMKGALLMHGQSLAYLQLEGSCISIMCFSCQLWVESGHVGAWFDSYRCQSRHEIVTCYAVRRCPTIVPRVAAPLDHPLSRPYWNIFFFIELVIVIMSYYNASTTSLSTRHCASEFNWPLKQAHTFSYVWYVSEWDL